MPKSLAGYIQLLEEKFCLGFRGSKKNRGGGKHWFTPPLERDISQLFLFILKTESQPLRPMLLHIDCPPHRHCVLNFFMRKIYSRWRYFSAMGLHNNNTAKWRRKWDVSPSVVARPKAIVLAVPLPCFQSRARPLSAPEPVRGSPRALCGLRSRQRVGVGHPLFPPLQYKNVFCIGVAQE